MNEIIQENAIVEGRADSSYWNVPHSTEIEGFATDMSVNAGTRVDFKINVNGGAGSDYIVEIFRLGYYGGSGAREVAQWTNTNATVQPDALVDASRGLVDAGNWSVTDGWNVPANAVSGVYLARLQRLDSNGDPIEGAVNQIPFIVRNDGETHDIVLQTSDTTWQAYNAWGGNNGEVGANLYGDQNDSINWDPIAGAGAHSQDRAYAVSYNRPFITADGTGAASGAQDYLFGADYAAIYWLEKQGYDVSYISGVDTDRLGADYLKNYQSFISVGHDEYWSGDQRANVEEARDSGVNLLFWSGNEVYWKTRWDVAYSADGTAYRTLVCYKETLAVADPNAGPQDYYNLDPSNTWTGTWMDTRFHGNPLAGGGNPQDVDPITGLNPACHCAQNQLTGQLFGPDGTGQFGGALDVPSNYGGLRVWRDTPAANGGQLDIAPGIIGYEWDLSPNDSMRPAGLIKLSETTLPWDGILVDQGNTTAPGVATHTLSLYRSESGALVFGAGTTFWSWALSNEHDSSPYGADIENVGIQQFVINMFADMGIQPGVADAFLISQGLKRASASTDTTAAVTSINDLPDTVAALSVVTITGTATDIDGNPLTTDGKVAAVEVSVDGGNTWKLASSADNWATWSFNWFPTTQGTVTIEARAIDDSLNVYNITPDSEAITVTAPTTFSAFSGATPGSPSLINEATTLELGMRFAVDRTGSVTELKYWRGSGDANDTDVREGHLWRADGTLLATVVFTSGVGQAGWQVANLSSPVTLTAGTQYIVSYRTNDNYVATNNYFVDANDVAFDGLDNNSFWGYDGVVRVVQDGVGGTNGVYHYGSGTMPSQSYNGANYWVDITFDSLTAPVNSAPVITSAAALTSPENRLIAGTITATDANANPLTYAIVGGADAALFTIDAQTGVLRFVSAPNYEAPVDAGANNVYDLTVSVSDGIAPAVTKDITVTVTDRDENGIVGSNVFDSTDAPPTTETTDPTDYELGMRFTANVAGTITELRYFRGAADASDTDTRVLNLWDAAGVLLGSVTVSSTAGESGWQVGTLSTPIAIQAGATYVVSYGTTQNYAATANYFTSAHSGPDGVLTAGVSAGVFADGAPGVFPTASYNASNYWVDVSFIPVSEPAVLSSATVGLSETNAVLTTGGTLTISDVDSPETFMAQAGTVGSYGTFTINAAGVWNYVASSAHDAFVAGTTYSDTFQVSSADGTKTSVTVNILGTNDAAVLSSATVGLSETEAVLTTGGALTISDVDSPATFVAQAGTVGSYGTFTIDAAGVWSYTASSAHDAFVGGTTYSDTFQVASADGTTTSVTVNILGTNDAVVVSSLTITGTQISFVAADPDNGTLALASPFAAPFANPAIASEATTSLTPASQAAAVSGTLQVTDGSATADVIGLYLGTGSGDSFTAGSTSTAIYGFGGSDILTGGTAADVIFGGTGADTIAAGGGNDTINLANGDFASGESIDGGANSDTIVLTNGTTVDFSLGTVTNVEALTGSTDSDTVTLSALQLAGLGTVDLVSGTDTLNVVANGNISQLALATMNNIDTGNLIGTSGTDSITLTGAQLNAILTGSATINLGSGSGDTINLTSASSDLNTLGATDASIQGVEAISAATAAAGVTITLSGQTEAFSITGSANADTITGGTGGDTIVAGSGNDTIAAGGGNDTINLANGDFASGESIDGGANSDTIVLTNATTVDFSLGTVTSVETLTGSTSSDIVTLSALQLAGLGTVNLVSGFMDTLNVVANGNISQLALATMNNIDTGNLIGTSGTDSITLTGAQLNAILIGSGIINLGSGTGDTINLTSTSSDLNSLGASNSSIQGVEAISAATAGAGVTITLSGQTEAFSITGSANADAITGGEGADTIAAGGGNDTINLANGDFASGESIDGGANSDTIVLTNGTTVDFSGSTVTNVETLTGSTSSDTVTLSALQLAGLGTVNLVSGFTDTLNVVANGDISQLALATMNNIDTGNLTGTSGTDSITLTGAQLNAILTGSATINLGSGTGDTINLTSTSSDLNTLGASNSSIQGVEAISAAAAAAGVTITLSGQTEAFSITGSANADTITGGTGADTIAAGGGNDILTSGTGSDQFVFNTALNAATNVDQITDFNVAADTIVLENAIFTTIVGTGTLTAAQFVANLAGTAQDASDRIVYETDTGKLFYDSNGDAAGGATQFAQLAAGLALTNNDFLIL